MPENLDWTNIALVVVILFLTIFLLVVFCRWLRRDNEERAYRSALERRRQGFYMVQDPENLGVWEVYSMMEEGREMQTISTPCTHTPPLTPPLDGSSASSSCADPSHKSVRVPIAKRRLEVISE